MRNRYPNFRRVQRERRPHYRGSRQAPQRSLGFGLLLAGLSVATFAGVYFSDRIPGAVRALGAIVRGVGRENTPPPGAYYSGCNEARAAGVAPIYADEPGYRPEMDGDSDGIACEPYRGRF